MRPTKGGEVRVCHASMLLSMLCNFSCLTSFFLLCAPVLLFPGRFVADFSVWFQNLLLQSCW